MENDHLALGDEKELVASKCNLPIPIVYTTKLDDMKIFMRNFDLLTTDTISSCIIKESKPKLMQLHKYPQRKSDISFHNMVQSLNEMNANAADNYTTLIHRVIKRKSGQDNDDTLEDPTIKRRKIEISCKTDTEITSKKVTRINTENLKVLSPETGCETNEVLKGKQEFYLELDMKTTYMENCIKEELLENSNCETIKGMRAMRRNIVGSSQELNLQSSTETAPDEMICINVEPLGVYSRESNNYGTEIKLSRQEFHPKTKTETCIDKALYVNVDNLKVSNTLSDSESNEETTEHNFTPRTKTSDIDLIRERNKELIKMCKPVSVVLDDIRASILGTSPNKYKSRTKTGKFNKVSDASLTVEDKTKVINLEIPLLDLTRNTYWRSQYLLYYNEFSRHLDIYYIDGNGKVTDYYGLDGDKTILNRTVLLPYIGNNDAVMLICCCWHQRDQTVKSLWPGLISYSASTFLKKPHSCVPGNCICCCQNNSTYTRLSSTDEKNTTCDVIENNFASVTHLEKNTLLEVEVDPISIDDYEIQDLDQEISSTFLQMQEKLKQNVAIKQNKDWLRQLLVSSNEQNLINSALRYTRNTPDKNKITFKNTCMKFPDRSSFIKIEAKNKSEAEWYELSANGEVITYTKRKGFPFAKSSTVYEICCWISRERLIASLFKRYAGPERNKCPGIQFIRKPHFCPLGNCTCCCKNKDVHFDEPVSVSDITLPKRMKTTRSTTVKQLNKVQTINKNIYTQPTKILPKPTTVPTEDQGVVNLLNATIPLKISPKTTTVTTEDQGVVDSLITTILDTFKDVRLTITEDGKVAAALKKPVNTLSTAELKVLSNILSHAQEQVKSLGLTPGTNLNNHIILPNAASQTTINHIQSSSNITIPVTSNMESVPLDTPNPANSSICSNIQRNEANNKNTEQGFLTNQFAITNPCKFNNLPIINTNNNYISLSKIYNEKNQNYINSFISHAQSSQESTQAVIPRIESIFSLQNENCNSNNDGDDLSALRAFWEKEPTNLSKNDVHNGEVDVHHKSTQKETSHTKIRVVSPSKLGVSNNPAVSNTFNDFTNNTMQIQTNTSVPDSNMIPGHGLIQLLPLTTYVESNFQSVPKVVQINNVNIPMSQDTYKNNTHMIPLANNIQLLPQARVNFSDISVHQATEVDPKEINIPEFIISKPTSLPINLAPIESDPMVSVLQPTQSHLGESYDKFIKNLSEMSTASKSSLDVIVTPQSLINNTIDQVLNSGSTELPNERLRNLLVAPRKTIRLEERPKTILLMERKVIPKGVEHNSSVIKKSTDIIRKQQVKPKRRMKESKPALANKEQKCPRRIGILRNSKPNNTRKSSKNRVIIEIEHDKDLEVPTTLNDSENNENAKLENPQCDVDIFKDISECVVNQVDNENIDGNDEDDNEDVCILGV